MSAETGKHFLTADRIPDPRPHTLGELIMVEKAGGTLSGQVAKFEANRARTEEARWDQAIETTPEVVSHGIWKRIPAALSAAKEYMRRFATEGTGKHRPERVQIPVPVRRRRLVPQMA